MGELSSELREFLDANRIGVLATIAGDGKPRQSLVYYARDDEQLLISTLKDRRKADDVARTGWASLCVMGHEPPFPAATFSGPAAIVTEGIGVPTAMIAHGMLRTPDPPEPMPDEALAEAGRIILRINVDRVSAVSHMGASG
jgi:PPOX class probable F420-dependent enzyme